MFRVRPLKDLPPGDSIRLEGQPPIAVLRTEGGEVERPLHASRFALRTVDAPSARPPVRVHEVRVTDGETWVVDADQAPNLPAGLTVGVHA